MHPVLVLSLTCLIMQKIAKLATVEMRWCHGKKQQNGRRSCSWSQLGRYLGGPLLLYSEDEEVQWAVGSLYYTADVPQNKACKLVRKFQWCRHVPFCGPLKKTKTCVEVAWRPAAEMLTEHQHMAAAAHKPKTHFQARRPLQKLGEKFQITNIISSHLIQFTNGISIYEMHI